MRALFHRWFERYFSDPEALILSLFIASGLLLFATLGGILAPVFASVVIAYLLYSLVARLERIKVPHILAVNGVFLLFVGIVTVGLLGIFPLLFRQLSNMFNQLPSMLERSQELIATLPLRYPDFISIDQIQSLMNELRFGLGKLGQLVLSLSLASIPNIISLSVYLILVPLLVYFFLLDKTILLQWFSSYLPKRRRVLKAVWSDLLEQIGNYVRGKVLEILIVAAVCYLVFLFMGLPYTLVLAALVGLSVIIPYVGAFLVTFPVLIIAFLQWGWAAHFAYFTLVYALIIILDANVLVPVLFSEVVKLHPVAIIVAVLIFGSLWGFWGVFFAIPLASLVKAILNAWPVKQEGHHS